MNLETVFFSNSQSNFFNLSLLICHLFVGGNFKVANILYTEEALDDRLLSEIDSTCLVRIPMTTLNISASALETFSIDPNQRTDHIIQLIFLPRDKLAENMNRIDGLLTFYRIFVFSQVQRIVSDETWIENVKFITNPSSNSLLLIHNSASGVFRSYRCSKPPNNFVEPIDLQNVSMSNEELFNCALGETALGRYFGVVNLYRIDCAALTAGPLNTILKMETAFANLYFTRLNLSFIERASVYCNETDFHINHTATRPIRRPIYNEYSLNFNPVEIDPMYEYKIDHFSHMPIVTIV